jgi:hypothetical protein
VIATPAIIHLIGERAVESRLPATNVAVREVKTRRYQIFGLVYS